MDDMILNPNINSSLLLRADVLWDDNSTTTLPENIQLEAEEGGIVPRTVQVKGYTLYRTLVRKFVPRNPELDRSLLQSCLFFREEEEQGDGEGEGEGEGGSLVIYLPHAGSVSEIPFYHPPVEGVAFLHRRRGDVEPTACQCPCGAGSTEGNLGGGEVILEDEYMLSIHHLLFQTSSTATTETTASRLIGTTATTPVQPQRLTRTLHHLLHKLHKNSTGTFNGYQKRVHHDRLLAKEVFQDLYLHLKARHAKRLMEGWVESTDPRKHVFEDIGIAAFLLGVWRERYYLPGQEEGGERQISGESSGNANGDVGKGKMKSKAKQWTGKKRPWVGFVDIGCGNGVLVDILRREGYSGYGIDARRRKTWDVLLNSPKDHTSTSFSTITTTTTTTIPWLRQELLVPTHLLPPSPLPPSEEFTYNTGIFPPHTFLISNHSDQLTGWTPLLATLSNCPFLAIPCCAYTLSGDKFRPGSSVSWVREALKVKNSSPGAGGEGSTSTYAGLVVWAEGLAGRCGWGVEREVLRIPSTRNVGILGWELEDERGEGWDEAVREVLKEEGGGVGWTEKVVALVGKKKDGH